MGEDAPVDTAAPRPDPDVARALGLGLAVHPGDGVSVMRPVRDDRGTVVAFRYEWVNDAAERNAGRPLLGLRLIEAYGSDATLFPLLCELLGTGQCRQVRVEYDTDARDAFLHSRTFDIFISDTGADRITCQYRDVTDLRRARALLEHQAAHDELTGVPNRRRLREHLDEVLGGLSPGEPSVLVMLADLDRFKAVNDTHGHPAGDRLLQLAAERMRAAMRATDLVTRYGGDEFVVVCHDVAGEEEARVLSERLRSAVAGTYRLSAQVEVQVGLSVGLALADRPMPTHELLERADRALYADKAAAGAAADAGG